jgi:hypothetical protein
VIAKEDNNAADGDDGHEEDGSDGRGARGFDVQMTARAFHTLYSVSISRSCTRIRREVANRRAE